MKKTKKLISLALSALIICSLVPAVSADDGIDYTINSSYDSVDWSTVKQYKTELHCHTTSSDGSNTLKEMVERHYELGYDIVAVTDHGTVDYTWAQQSYAKTVKTAMMIKEGATPIEGLGESGVAANASDYTLETSADGNEYYYQTADGKRMLRLPFGIENNPTSFNNAHVNSWFVDYGNDKLGGTSDYKTPISSVDKLGGLSVINHPGEYTNARDEVYTADAYNTDNAMYNYYISKFASLLLNYDSCLGIDINSKGDSRTRFDRKLWDELLSIVIPASDRNVYAIGSSDAHNLDIVNSGFTTVLAGELTVEAVKNALENGEFFAASRYIGNVDELSFYASALGNDNAFGAVLAQTVAEINGEISANDEQSTKFEADKNAAAPVITGISVDEGNDTITVTAENAELIAWTANGEYIATGSTIDLDDYSDKIGSYVRAEIVGEGGIVYTQAFILHYDGEPVSEFNSCFFDFGIVASIICDTFVKILGFILPSSIITFAIYGD